MKRILSINYRFTRDRLRRGLKLVDPKFKDLTATQQSQAKIEILRDSHQKSNIQHFTQVLSIPRDKIRKKIGQRFEVNRQQLQSTIKQVHKRGAHLSKIQQIETGSLNFLTDSNARMYDQTAQIQFEKQFKKRLFYKKEIARLMQNKDFDPKNHISGKKDRQFVRYLQNKRQLKNRKIGNMMCFSRNNQHLQLLIESGLVDNPQKFKQVIEKLQNDHQKSVKLIQHYQEKISSDQISRQNNLIMNSDQMNSLNRLTKEQQHKIAQIVQGFNEMHQKDKLSYRQQVNILHQIKQYQNKVFLQRYEAINFRFKGQTKFSHLKQIEMKSYVKHTNIEPKDLLQIFVQNQNKISKLGLPIITPTVMSAIYAKTSFYVFPQNLQNNRINMLNDRNFVYLEKQVFTNIHNLDNTSFADILWSYAKNHSEQSGLLRPEMSAKIQDIIFSELKDRVASLSEQDLGLCMRSAIKLCLKDQQRDWKQIVQVLQQKLPLMQQSFQIESVLNLLALIPTEPYNLRVVRKNLPLLAKFNWQFEETLTTFIRVTSYLLNNHRNDQLQHLKSKIREIITQKFQSKQIQSIISQYSINKIGFFISLLVKSETQIVQLNNICKKYAIQSIKLQKEELNPKTLTNVTMSLSLLDYYAAFKERPNSLKLILPGRVLIFNSKKYFVYHELAKFSHTELQFLDNNQISRILYGCSLVQYKNEGLYDSAVDSLLRKIDFQSQKSQKRSSNIQIYLRLIQVYSLQKRVNNYYFQIKDKVFLAIQQTEGRVLSQLKPNEILSFLISIFSLQGDKIADSHIKILNLTIDQYFNRYLKHLSRRDLISILFISTFYTKQCQIRPQLFSSLTKHSEEFSVEELFVIKLCTSIDEYRQIKVKSKRRQSYTNIQQFYYDTICEEMLRNQQHIGTQFIYTHVYDKFKLKIEKKYPDQQIVELPWRIQVPGVKKVFFFATYDHIMVKNEIIPDVKRQGKSVVSLYGIWKTFPMTYENNNWNCQTIYTFLQSSNSLSLDQEISNQIS